MAAGDALPLSGVALLSVNDFDKGAIVKIARDLHRLGFRLLATRGTAEWLTKVGMPVERVKEYQTKLAEFLTTGKTELLARIAKEKVLSS
jgi:carbamoyl-phosphate synthase large subunit